MAITTHESADVGVCMRNVLMDSELGGLPRTDIAGNPTQRFRTVDLDVDIGADAVDYK